MMMTMDGDDDDDGDDDGDDYGDDGESNDTDDGDSDDSDDDGSGHDNDIYPRNCSFACSKMSSSISMFRSSSIAPARSASLSMQSPKQAWKKLLKLTDLFANGPIPASANHR